MPASAIAVKLPSFAQAIPERIFLPALEMPEPIEYVKTLTGRAFAAASEARC